MLDSIYGQVMRMRRRRFEREPDRQRRLSKPVISIGNLSMGGTGKTPVCAQLAIYLHQLGERPAILTRGYKRKDNRDGVVVVRGNLKEALDHAGDEPTMLFSATDSRAEVYVSPDRFLAGRLAESQGATVHLLDDGFQHLQLARDFDILVTTVGEIPNGRVIPFGRLREPMDAASRANFLIVVNATAEEAAAEAGRIGIEHSCGASPLIHPPRTLEPPVEYLSSKDARVLAVAGIANPERFRTSLRREGWNVVDMLTFPDHHRYDTSDVETIARRLAGRADVAVTTSKDALKFQVLGPAPFPLYAVNMVLNFDPPPAPYEAVKAVLG